MTDPTCTKNHELDGSHSDYSPRFHFTTKQGEEAPQNAFAAVVWEALHADHNDLRKQKIILMACRAEITKAQIEVLEELVLKIEGIVRNSEVSEQYAMGRMDAANIVRARITSSQDHHDRPSHAA